jgi:MFS family permease
VRQFSGQDGQSEQDGPGGDGGNGATGQTGDRYKWIALTNTTLGITMATIDASIVIISMPAIFRGIHLNPLGPGNVSYLLWMIMGYLLVTAVLVVSLGRLGDIYGRVRIYNLGFVVFTVASIALSLDPLTGSSGALWLIGWRIGQAFGGAMLMANAAAILTDAFPARQRGMALGINQISAISGQLIGLLLGGLLAAWDWRAVFWVNVPIGIFGTVWAYRSLHEIATTRRARIDWIGNITFALGAGLLLVSITYGIQPYGGHPTGWTSPFVLGGVAAGVALLIAFCIIETKIAEPMFQMSLFRIRAFAAGNIAGLLGAISRGGLQFMLIIWLQGIWLPLHGYDFAETPLWAGIYLVPLAAGFLTAGPLSGYLSDRYGQRLFATSGLLLTAAAFAGLLSLPVDFPYWEFAFLIFLNGVGSGLFASPNTSAIMSSVPARYRGAASGMRATFQNSGTSLSIGIFFSLLIVGVASALPRTLGSGLRAQGVPAGTAAHIASLPPVSTLFASFLGYNPLRGLLAQSGELTRLPARNVAALTDKQFFAHLISGPFHQGLVVVFSAAIVMSVTGALVSLSRGKQFYYDTPGSAAAVPAPARPVPAGNNGDNAARPAGPVPTATAGPALPDQGRGDLA